MLGIFGPNQSNLTDKTQLKSKKKGSLDEKKRMNHFLQNERVDCHFLRVRSSMVIKKQCNFAGKVEKLEEVEGEESRTTMFKGKVLFI